MHLSKLYLHIVLLTVAALVNASPVKPAEKPAEAKSSSIENEESDSISYDDDELEPLPSYRQPRMLSFWDYFNTPYYTIPQPTYIPYPYYNAYDPYDPYGDDDYEMDIASRANIVKRRPGPKRRQQYQDSPIFYIRLPPTPYMFVPGSGYVSQPPTFNPLMSMPPVSQPMPAVPAPVQPVAPVSPLISIPLNFVSNARPTSVFHFGSSLQPQYVPQAPNMNPQFGMSGPMPGMQAVPQYYPTRPHHRPSRPRPSMSDSDMTQLKGQFLFNGRPNQIYLLTNNAPSPMYTNRMNPYY